MNDEETVRLLKEHYKGNVLGHEQDQKHQEVEERLCQNGMLDKRLLAEGLDRRTNNKGKIDASDLEGCELEFNLDLHAVVVKVPEEKSSSLMKKLGLSALASGGLLNKQFYEEGSPFYSSDVVVVTGDKSYAIDRAHELSHLAFAKHNPSLKDINSVLETTEGEKRLMVASLLAETSLVDEVFAYGMQWDKISVEDKLSYIKHSSEECADIFYRILPDCGTVSKEKAKRIVEESYAGYLRARARGEEVMDAIEKFHYLASYSGYMAQMTDEAGVLPDCGWVSKEKAKETTWKATFDYLEKRLDTAIEAFGMLKKNVLPESLEKFILSIGPTRKEFESGKYVRPIDELVEALQGGSGRP